jgi:hypothetical protein
MDEVETALNHIVQSKSSSEKTLYSVDSMEDSLHYELPRASQRKDARVVHLMKSSSAPSLRNLFRVRKQIQRHLSQAHM